MVTEDRQKAALLLQRRRGMGRIVAEAFVELITDEEAEALALCLQVLDEMPKLLDGIADRLERQRQDAAKSDEVAEPDDAAKSDEVAEPDDAAKSDEVAEPDEEDTDTSLRILSLGAAAAATDVEAEENPSDP